jgi:hypothetical protein
LFVCSTKRQERLLRRTRAHQSLGITVVLRHWRIGPEHRCPIKRERTVQHSGYSCPGFAKHKEQLQRNSVHSGDALQFQQNGKPGAEVNIASVRALFLGEESKQVGGLPVKLGKAAAPYGGGRVVSLFAHKKYDTLTLEYVDSDGGVHGAIFEVAKGQGELVRNELVARGVASSSGKDQPTKQSTSEVTYEDK